MSATEKKINANRANAKVSPGPRTQRGKARASKNALRHGLSLPVACDPRLSAGVRRLVQKIAGNDSDPAVVAAASRIAEAQLDLSRIQDARHALLITASPITHVGGIDQTDVVKKLVALDRYERRAFSRRKFAIRDLDVLRH